MTLTAIEQRLDIMRGDLVVALHALALHLQIANDYLELAADDRLETVVADAAERMGVFSDLTSRLLQARRDAAINGEAAQEWRASRRGRAA